MKVTVPLPRSPGPVPLLRSPGQLGVELSRRNVELLTTAQFLLFEPGLYVVEFQTVQSGRTDVGLRLPCVRIEAVPSSTDNTGRLFVSSSEEGGWLSANTHTAFVLVTGGRAGGVLTVYRASGGMPAPEIRIRAVVRGADLRAGAVDQGPAMPSQAIAGSETLAAEREEASEAVPVSILVHVMGKGDVPGSGSVWAGSSSGNAPIEGFAVTASPGLDVHNIEYQGILGKGWSTPWYPGGEFCGSRGMGLSLLGFRLRLTGAAAAAHNCRYWGNFSGRGIVGPMPEGEACESNGAPLTGLRVDILPRSGLATDTKPPPEEDRVSAPIVAAAPQRAAKKRKPALPRPTKKNNPKSRALHK